MAQLRRDSRAGPALDRAELAWMAVVGAVAAVAFAATMSSRVSLGDAPESVAGIASVGILHAPGYPAYVLAARLFTLIVPFGSITWRTNLFSLVCAVLVVIGAYRVARLVGASRPGAAIGGLTLALGTSFWFYADFAKHDTFSALLVAGATVLVLEWYHRRDLRLLIAAGAVLGLTIGASWQLGALAAPGLVLLVILGRDRDVLAKLLAAAVTAGFVAAIAIIVVVMVRASQHPVVNWGSAATPARVVDLLDMKDFSFVNKRLPSLAPHSAEHANVHGATLPERFGNYPTLLAREAGAGALLVAVWGATRSVRRLARPVAVFLAVSFGVGVVGTAEFVGPGALHGFETNLIVGGFYSGIFFVVAVWAAVGVTDLVELAEGRSSMPRRGRSRGRGAAQRARGVARRGPAVVGMALTVALAGVVLVPSAVVHWRPASQRQPPFADDYATNVFRSLPPRAAILTRGGELTFSLLYHQLVRGERRDVLVIAADSLAGSSWYRGDLARRLGMKLPDLASQGAELVAVAHQIQRSRPMYMDMLTTDALRPALGYVARGLVSEVVDGVGAKPVAAPADIEQLLDEYRSDGVYDGAARRRWPNTFLLSSYVRAHLELARDYNELGQLDHVATHAEMALEVNPGDKTAAGILKAVADARAKNPSG